MSEPVGALDGASFEGLVHIGEAGPRAMLTVRGDPTSSILEKAIIAATGLGLPAPNRALIEGDRAVFWMSPDELLVMLPRADAEAASGALRVAMEKEHALVVDVSDARSVFTLSGKSARVRETLAKLTPADLRPEALPVGMLRRTRLAQVPAAFVFTSETRAELICFRSVADYVFGILKHAAMPGSEVGHFDG